MKEEIYLELEQIRRAAGGYLRPTDIVEYARNEASVLHSYFTWDDSEAAYKYRLAEARALIRVCVHVSEQTSEKIRAFVSLTPDRNSSGGYRAIADVLDNQILMEVLMKDVIAELAAFKRKFERFRELAEINGLIEEADRIVNKYTSQSEVRASA